MIVPCESAAKYYLPAMKCAIAQELYNAHHVSQEKIAKALGITQAQVSKYLSHKVSGDVERTLKVPKVARDAREIAKKIASGKSSGLEISKIVCRRCADLFSHKGCEFSSI